jgi:hypothetical protein
MAGMPDTLEDLTLRHFFENGDIGEIGDATGLRGSTTAGNWALTLHTADPGESGLQTTSEATYGGYTSTARKTVARSTAGWTVTSGTADNDAVITFDACTSGSNTITHIGIGTNTTSASGTQRLVFVVPLTASLAVSTGITPEVAIGDCNVSLD